MHALANVIFGLLSPALAIRQRNPALNTILEAYVYRTYAEYFRAVLTGEEPDHPASDNPVTEKLFTALWTTIVFREEHQLDELLLGTELARRATLPNANGMSEEEESEYIEELDELYALAFEELARVAARPGGTVDYLARQAAPPNVQEAPAPTPQPEQTERPEAAEVTVIEEIAEFRSAVAGLPEESEDIELADLHDSDTTIPLDPPVSPPPPPSAPAAAPTEEEEEIEEADGTTPQAYVLKITLEDVQPPIWRRVTVLEDTPLADLHKIIQSAMGWSNTHLHQFSDRVESYGPPSDYLAGEHVDYTFLTVGDLLGVPGAVLFYEYDFGDGWRHRVELERTQSPVKGQDYPLCTGGRRACPPEDVGGAWGYEQFLAAISDPEHPDHADQLRWIDGEFDSEWFDLLDTNYRLHSKNYGVFESTNPFLRGPQ